MKKPSFEFDLVIQSHGGKVITADGPQEVDIGITGKKITALRKGIPISSTKDHFSIFPGDFASMGWIDRHVHIAPGCRWSDGIQPEKHCVVNGGCTTVVDAGSNGTNNFRDFRKYLIDRKPSPIDGLPLVQIFGDLNIVPAGLASEHRELFPDNMTYVDPRQTAAFARQHPGVIRSIKARIAWLQATPSTWEPALKATVRASDMAGIPPHIHINHGPELDRILSMVPPKTTITHCFHGRGQDEGCTILDDSLNLRESVKKALRRGVYFDLGHGQGGYDHQVGKRAIREMLNLRSDGVGLSTDLHCGCVNGPVYNFSMLMTKALTWPGFTMLDLIPLVTVNPAQVLGLPKNRGVMKVGSPAHLTIFTVKNTKRGMPMVDAQGRKWTARKVIQPITVVIDGVRC